MELPFAVDSPEPIERSRLNESTSDHGSLMTASSQGSLLETVHLDASHRDVSTSNARTNGGSLMFSSSSSMFGRMSFATTVGAAVSALAVNTNPPSTRAQANQPPSRAAIPETETVDFTYVNVCETDADEVDIIFDSGEPASEEKQEIPRGDVLALLLSEDTQLHSNEAIVAQCEEANKAAQKASIAKGKGDLQEALQAHTEAAKMFRAVAVDVQGRNAAMSTALLLMSQSQAKSALALKRIVKRRPEDLLIDTNSGSDRNGTLRNTSQQERLRAAVRGALNTRNEADMSDSAFLGKATKGPISTSTKEVEESSNEIIASPDSKSDEQENPVDDMMALERELRDMDMTLELGNSIASLDARTHNRLKNSISEGSFMVVPPGSNSHMSSSSMWSPTNHGNASQRSHLVNPAADPGRGTANVRARANRVQNIASNATQQAQPITIVQPPMMDPPTKTSSGLESSWWGNSSTMSQVLTSSVISHGNPAGGLDQHGGMETANTKQIMRLMDALKTLGDENANLLREVEGAEAARQEARGYKAQMARFKVEYAKRFEALKGALEKFRKGYPDRNGNAPNPVTNSEFMKAAQFQRQEQLIRKLTAELKTEKKESKKKDAALRKYESFYREVKTRSAQKAAQRERSAEQLDSRPQSRTTKRGMR